MAIAAAMLAGAPPGETAPARRSSTHGQSSEAPVLLVADELQNDEDLGLVVARGHVELSQKDQIVLADTITYNQKTDTVTASGNVSLLQPTGDVVFSNYVELHDDMRDGFIENIRILLSDRSRLAGNTARRVGGVRTEIRRGVYSPCELCATDPTHAPLWQIKAERIVHDKEKQLIEYRDAIVEFDGVPVLYTPYLSSPDPSVKRQTGFLAPIMGSSSSLGFHTSIPYYLVLGPNTDTTLTPIITTKGGEALAGEYRQNFTDGFIDLDGSVADSTVQNSTPVAPEASSVETFRGHFYGRGEFDLDSVWRTGFDINRATDQTYTRLFHFNTFNSSGYNAYLQSRAFVEGLTQQSYTLIDSYIFQDVRAGIGDTTQPIVLPSLTYDWVSRPDGWNGVWRLSGNTINLFRPNGTDIRRVSAGGGWSAPLYDGIGDLWTVSLNLRADGYHSNGVLLSSEQPNGHTEATGRFFPQAELEWRYPWVRRGANYNATIEPIAALIASSNGGNSLKIPDEDSVGVEFDETSLFVPNRFPGYDRVDSGQRVDYGLNLGVYGDGGGSTRLLIGQSYRFQKTTPFPLGVGLDNQRSDVVGRLVVSPGSYLDLYYRARLDRRDFTVRRQEVGFTGGPRALRLDLSFIDIAADPLVAGIGERRQVSGTAVSRLSQYWSAEVFGTRNIGTNAQTFANGAVASNPQTLSSGVAISYRDECFTLSASLAHSGTSDREIHPGTTLLFSFVLKNIGEFGVPAFSTGSSLSAPIL